MKILNRSYLVLAILMTVVGIVQSIRWTEHFGPVVIGYLLNLLPATIFFGTYCLSRHKTETGVHVVAIPLLIMAVGFWGFYTFIAETLISFTAEVTNARRYESVLDTSWKHNHQELVEHFPRPIPPDAKDVRFSFQPAFLQGGTHVQLRYSTAPETISELYERFSRQKTKSFFGGESDGHRNQKGGMPTTRFYTSGSEDREFPKDYEIMIFDPVLAEKDRPPGFYWNHCRTHGVAISKERNQIVYWAERW
jgi:hypothetical protein